MSDAHTLNLHPLNIAPPAWDRRPLWSILKRREVTGRPEAQLLSIYRDHGVVPTDSRDDNFNKPGENLNAYRHVRPGDLVINKMKAWQGSLAVSDYEGIVSPAYVVCELSPHLHPRFIHYLLRSHPYVYLCRLASKGIRPNQWDLPFDVFRTLPVVLPPTDEQRRIADFLDTEVSRIDQMRDLHTDVARKAEEHKRALINREIDHLICSYGVVPLRRSVTSIEQGASPQCYAMRASPDEWGVLKLSAVKDGRFSGDECKVLPVDLLPSLLPNRVQPGDFLVTRANTPELVGDAAVADKTAFKRLLPDLIYRVNLTQAMDAHFACSVVRGTRTRELIQASARGSSQSMVKLRADDIKEWPVPFPPLRIQRDFVRTVQKVRGQTDSLRSAIRRQLGLLIERRQALITAAVTGQIDVTTARGVRD